MNRMENRISAPPLTTHQFTELHAPSADFQPLDILFVHLTSPIPGLRHEAAKQLLHHSLNLNTPQIICLVEALIDTATTLRTKHLLAHIVSDLGQCASVGFNVLTNHVYDEGLPLQTAEAKIYGKCLGRISNWKQRYELVVFGLLDLVNLNSQLHEYTKILGLNIDTSTHDMTDLNTRTLNVTIALCSALRSMPHEAALEIVKDSGLLKWYQTFSSPPIAKTTLQEQIWQLIYKEIDQLQRRH